MNNKKINKMCYLIHCHTNYEQVNYLIRKLNNKYIDFVINVDKKSDIYNNIIKLDNVFLVEKRRNINWGTSSQIYAIIDSLKYVLDLKNKYSYIHLISGQDFPIKNNDYIINFFNNNNKEYIAAEELPRKCWYNGGFERLIFYYPQFLIKRNSFILRIYLKILRTLKLKRSIDNLPKLYGGSSWFSLTGECCKYIVDFIENNDWYLKIFNNTMCCDEIFFQTIIMNSPYGKNVVNDNLRFIKWNEGSVSPNLLSNEDLEILKNSEKIFARKFDLKKNDFIYVICNYLNN